MQLVFSDRLLTIYFDSEHSLLRMNRSAEPAIDAEDHIRSHQQIAIWQAKKAARLGLFDQREAPSRHDREFERITLPVMAEHMARFQRTAVLVLTAVGALHVQHIARQGNSHVRGFHKEDAALEYLLAGR